MPFVFKILPICRLPPNTREGVFRFIPSRWLKAFQLKLFSGMRTNGNTWFCGLQLLPGFLRVREVVWKVVLPGTRCGPGVKLAPLT
jgi:hypothetical protein